MASTIVGPRDPNSLANYNNWRTRHTTAELEVNFEQRIVSGHVTLQLEPLTDSQSKEIVLDTSFLDIKTVSIAGTETDFSVGERIEPYGAPLTITVPDAALGKQVTLKIGVATTERCTALQWLTPAQTRGKSPYMFSQCQAIHARSIFPCQDTPDIKSTFTFSIKSPLPVIASGIPVGSGAAVSDDSSVKLYTFEQKVPMTSYLFALASGDIVTAPIGPRSVVAAGPDQIADAKWELERDTEKFIQVAERLAGPYVWGEFNCLVLPPSFPYGGMENPQYTFLTPTVVSKDRENVDVVAHELSHSWSGNLVSNASWEHFWLNEGWTTYLERRIQAAVHGESHRDFSAIIGWKALEDSVNNFGLDHEFTKLIIDLKGKDPDDAFSSVPYEKGFHFLYYLEKLITRDIFDEFIPHYFAKWQKKSLDSYDFKATLLEFFASDEATSKKLASVDWDTWFYKPGLPPKPKFDTSMVDKCYALADKWQSATEDFKPSPKDIEGWSANQVVVFLERVEDFEKPLSPTSSRAMGIAYNLASSYNVELSSRYFRIGLRAKNEDVYQPTADLLGTVGRMKFVRPLFRALIKVDKPLAVETFEKNKDFYHPICRGMVEKDLGAAYSGTGLSASSYLSRKDSLCMH